MFKTYDEKKLIFIRRFIKIFIFFITLLNFFSLIGCVSSHHAIDYGARYYAIVYYEKYNEIFRGDVWTDLLSGKDYFQLKGEFTGIQCEGYGMLNYPLNRLSCAGKGEIVANCSDGRILIGNYTSNSCIRKYGKGSDNLGDIFVFKFGLSSMEMNAEMHNLITHSKNKPDLPEYKAYSKEKIDKTKIRGGTGFFFAKNGWILTNYHVIKEAKQIKIITYDGKIHEGKLREKDPVNDIAVLKIENDYPILSLDSSVGVQKGTDVITLGYPLISLQGYEAKASFGKVNALSGIENDVRYFQIDISIQPGNSGSPLIDSKGNVIGIVTATLDPLKTIEIAGFIPQNVNYALKIDYVFPILSKLGFTLNTERNKKDLDFKKIISAAEKSIVLIIVD